MVIGIDPGFKGALAVFDGSKIVDIIDMPIQRAASLRGPTGRGSSLYKTPETVSAEGLALFIRKYSKDVRLVVLERVGAMPGQGVSSMFRFGEGYGVVQGVVSCLGLRLMLVPPAVWKSQMNVSRDKNSSLERIRGQFPAQHAKYFSLKKHDGRAEALLLAMFGARSLGLTPHGRDEINAIL